MVDWDSQDDPIAMATSTVVIVAAGVAFAWFGFTAAEKVTAVDAVLGVIAGVTAVSLQTWVAALKQDGNDLVSQLGLMRFVVAGLAGVAGVAVIDVIPGVTAAFGVTLIPLGVVSRVYLYNRTSRD